MYYVTKYALTQGIIVVKAPHARVGEGGYLYFKPRRAARYAQVHRNDWFTDLESAKRRAEELRKKKAASLRRQAKKIAQMKIEVVER